MTPLQADGLACIEAPTISASEFRMCPVGPSVTGSQVFACVVCCPDQVQREVTCGDHHGNLMWTYFVTERSKGRTPTEAELDRVAGTNNYGRKVLRQ